MPRHRETCKVLKYAEKNNVNQLHEQIYQLNKTIQTIQSADHDSLIREIAILTQKIEDKDGQIKTKDQQLVEKDEQIQKLQDALVAEPKVVNNNYFDVNIKAIDDITLKHITDDDKSRALNQQNVAECIPAIVERIYWGDEPRNACIKIPNKRCREWLVQKRVNGKAEEKRACHVDKDDVIFAAIEDARIVLRGHVAQKYSVPGSRFLQHDDLMTKSLNGNKKLFKEQMKRTEMKMLDHCTTK
eukprot:4251095-Prymnesium_polylepis.1